MVLFSTESVTFDEAVTFCASRLGYLYEPIDIYVTTSVMMKAFEAGIWTSWAGITDDDSDGLLVHFSFS